MNDDPNLLDMTFTIVNRNTDEPVWRVHPTIEVYRDLAFAIRHRPGSHQLVIYGDFELLDPREVMTDRDEAKRRVHALIFDEHLRSLS
jgi:hypothetical protein